LRASRTALTYTEIQGIHEAHSLVDQAKSYRGDNKHQDSERGMIEHLGVINGQLGQEGLVSSLEF